MENYPSNANLSFYDRPQYPIKTNLINIALTPHEDTLKECRLTLQASPETYQQIETSALFNLKSEFRGSLSNGEFLPDQEIQLEMTLNPDLLPQLLSWGSSAENIASHLSHLSGQGSQTSQSPEGENAPDVHPLLNPENWFCLSVKQQQGDRETGYTTFWHYVNPTLLHTPDASSEQIAAGITTFAEQWAETNVTAATEQLTTEILGGITSLFEGFDTWLDDALSSDSSNGNGETRRSSGQPTSSNGSILGAIIAYFTADDWTFTKLQGEPVVQLAYQGENGLWNCYAQAREEEEQFVFYSIYSELVLEERRGAIAELLTRINYGLVIGNFEMDFNDGEIRYKTSIAVEESILTHAMIKRIVYANVSIMDYYLLSIQAVMEGEALAEEAIAQCSKLFDGLRYR